MIDNQANDEQEKYFKEHVEKCLYCLRQYNLEKKIQTMLQQQANRQQAPSDLVDSIRTAIIPTQ